MRRLTALACLLVLLSGCGGADDRAPFTDSRIPPSLGPGFWAPEGWAWGLIGVGDAPVQRYGVSSTAGAPRANILILTGYGETAEVWFETARDLNGAGYTVWVLERAGQGGSARYASIGDVVHVPSFEGDVAAVKALARAIVQSDAQAPLVILGQAEGGLVGLRAVQIGAPADVLFLSNARLKPSAPLSNWPDWLMKAGVGRLPASLNSGWKREGPDAFSAGLTRDRERGGLQKTWQIANPDLRMGGPSLGWNSAFAKASEAAIAGLETTTTPTRVFTTGQTPERLEVYEACSRMPKCAAVVGIDPPPGENGAAVGASTHLGLDGLRGHWLQQVRCAVPAHPTIPTAPEGEVCGRMDFAQPRSSGHPL